MKAVILAGGKGARLKPFTVSFPKPLVPIGDMPVLEFLLRRLIKSGVTDITLTLGHMAELIKAYLSEHRMLSSQLNITYVHEEQPTGTAGSLSLVDGLNDTFLVMNGDLLTNLDFNNLVRFHRDQGGILTIAAKERKVKTELGVIELNNNNEIIDYIEKPEHVHTVSMGVYVYEPRALEHIEHGKYLDFPTLVLRLLESGEKVVAYPSTALWLDIGNPDDYAEAQLVFEQHREEWDFAE